MEWDNLPSRWTVARLGDVAPVSGENVEPLDEPDRNFNYIGLENIESNTGRLINFAPTKGMKIKSTKRRFTQQHVLYGKLRPYLNKVWLPTFEGICATDLLPLLPDQTVLDRRYLAAFLRSPFFVEYSKRHMTGTKMPRLRMPAFTKAQIPIPPLDEQRRIVACIEELTERIDAARRLRTEAAEEAAAILPTALAEVFEETEARGWEMRWLSEVADINMGQSPPGTSYNQEGIGLPLVGGASDLGEVYPSPSKWTSQPSKTSRPGDIIICVRATIGDLNWADKEYCLGRGVAGLTPKEGIEPGFLFHYLRSQHAELNARGTGSTFKQISKSTLVGLPVPLPPLDEQRRIAEYLDAVQAKLEAIRRYQEETREEIEAMTGAVLERAFGGEL